MAFLGQMTGALLLTLLISRLMLVVTRSWQGGITRLLTVHVFSWLLIAFLAGLGAADGGAFAGLEAGATYLVPQLVWFVVDVVHHRIKARRAVAVSAPRQIAKPAHDCKYPPAEPGALGCEPLKAADRGR
jgi:hypothetical protein